MDVCIKNVDENAWRTFKSEAVKKNVKVGTMFNLLIKNKSSENSNLGNILYGKKFFTDRDVNNIKKVMTNLRKEYEFR